MTINLIDELTYDRLVAIQKFYPNLTYQNVGYSYPDKSKWSGEDLAMHKEVTDILKASITGFSEFNHFRLVSGGEVQIRFQYDWTADDPDTKQRTYFVGVGYLEIDELFTGFKNKE